MTAKAGSAGGPTRDAPRAAVGTAQAPILTTRVESAAEFLAELRMARLTHTDACLVIPPALCALISNAAWQAILLAEQRSKKGGTT